MLGIYKNNEQNSFFKRFDILGIPITIRFNSNHTHRTTFGALITIGIMTILIIQLVEVFSDTASHKNFRYIFQENVVEVPKKFDIKPNTFIFAFGIDQNLQHFIDEEIYKVEAILSESKKSFNNTSQQYEFVTKDIAFKPVRCTSDHFKINGVNGYFLKLPYKDLYCFPLDMNISLEGQYGADIYRRLRFRIKYCSGNLCKPINEVQKKLTNISLKIYYVNYAARATDYEQPFQPIAMNTFWQNSYSIMKNLNIYFRNAFFESSEGLISQETTVYHNLIYGFDREQLVSQTDNIMFEFYISLEKNKESQYIRQYAKLSEGVSQVGGMFNILFSIGCIISYPFSQLNFQQDLLNSIFSFSKGDNTLKKSENLQGHAQEVSILNKSESNQKAEDFKQQFQSKLIKRQSQDNQEDVQGSLKSNFRLTKCGSGSPFTHSPPQKRLTSGDLHKSVGDSPIEQLERFSLEDISSPQVQKSNLDSQVVSSQTKQQPKPLSIFKSKGLQIINFQQIKLRLTDILKGLLSSFCFLKFIFKSKRSQMVNAALKQLDNYLDIYTIITKIQELDKLKHLILNQDQIKLFDFIPQSVFYENDFKESNEINTFSNLSSQLNLSNFTKKSPHEKAYEAQDAYVKIFKQQNSQKISKIDKKILSLLDPEVSKFLEQGSVNYSSFMPQKVHKTLI